jgi:putative redox protein
MVKKYVFENPIQATIGTVKYKVAINWRNGIVLADEPFSSGGQETGPDPFTLLLSSLASCTLSTLRMYIDRKDWKIPEIFIEVNMFQENDQKFTTTIERKISFNYEISEEQKAKLLLIANKCPISKILDNQIIINTAI